ncbi:MAG TPA: magnesium/cobalt transporter CorA [Anaerolineales bacterium]|nr:magnesium/cobalt transporter CorA [Anaerolineales bacterium]
MIRAAYYTKDDQFTTDLEPDAFKKALDDPDGLLWVDFEASRPEEDEPILLDIFKFHPLAVDDALRETHVPKVDDWGQFLYIVLQDLVISETREHTLMALELDVFLGENFLVTHHDQKLKAIEELWSTIQRDERHLINGPDHLLYRLVDELATGYVLLVEKLDERIDSLEDEIFNHSESNILEQIFTLKRATLQFQRTISPEREVLNKLARDDYPMIDEQARVYYRDVYDHMVRLHDLTESLRDLASGSLDTYLSVINNRTNDIMKTLTIITAFFMPLSFITGFFGMNFFAAEPPFAAWVSLPVLVGTMVMMVGVPVGMYFWMRRQGWTR